jgi:hypothetical protein
MSHRTKTLLSQDDFEGLIARILLKEYPDRAMSVAELKDFLPDIPGLDTMTMTYAPSGNQILHIGDLDLEVGPMASHEEIRLALVNPTVKTANTKVTVKPMTKPWQGLAQKVGKLVHDAQAHAAKISARVDAAGPRMETAVGRVNTYLDGHEHDIKDVEDFAAEMEGATNGGPPLS